jgi:3-mercaptopyruvate sulfurtransferase SseA
VAFLLSKAEALNFVQHNESPFVIEAFSDFHESNSKLQREEFSALKEYRHDFYIQLNVDAIEATPLWNILPLQQLELVLLSVGVPANKSTPIIIFDTLIIRCGHQESRSDVSCRLWLVLKSLGYETVSVVLASDINDEFIIAMRTAIAAKSIRSDVGLNHERYQKSPLSLLLSYEDVYQLIKRGNKYFRLLDCRSEAEFNGQVTGYNYVAGAGTIPKAESLVNGDFQLSGSETIAVMLKRLNDLGITEEDLLIWYCGTGWRASRMCALSFALGYFNAKIYDGGWYEWQLKGLPAFS